MITLLKHYPYILMLIFKLIIRIEKNIFSQNWNLEKFILHRSLLPYYCLRWLFFLTSVWSLSIPLVHAVITNQSYTLLSSAVGTSNTVSVGKIDNGQVQFTGTDPALSTETTTRVQFPSAVKQRHFSNLALKRTSHIGVTPPFLYTVSPENGRVGLITTDGVSVTDLRRDEIDFSDVVIIECGSKAGFLAREGYVNHQTLFGNTGYEEQQSPCNIAKKMEYKWFQGDQLGEAIWYSHNESGDIQCLSFDATHCLRKKLSTRNHRINQNIDFKALDNNALVMTNYLEKYDRLNIITKDGHWAGNIILPPTASNGKVVNITRNSSWPVTVNNQGQQHTLSLGESYTVLFIHNQWLPLNFNINDYPDLLAAAKPLACGKHHQLVWGITGYHQQNHWCTKLLKPSQSLHRHNLQEMLDSKAAHMDRLFDQMLAWKLVKLDQDHKYTSLLKQINQAIYAKGIMNKDACAWYSVWNGWGLVACYIITEHYDDLVAEYQALLGEKKNSLAAIRAQVEEGRTMGKNKLHQQWAQSDTTHFAALLKEESQTMDQLRGIQYHYDKTAEQKHQQYVTAVEKYMEDTDPKNIVKNIAEGLPLLGPEIKNIVNYSENPSAKNLRHMLLGLAGPVGESVEGGIELSHMNSGLSSGGMKFLTDVLTDLGQDDTIGEALEDIVSDAINDLGDEAIASIRQAGLWVDKASDDPLLEVDYANITDLKSQLARYEYDPWEDESMPASHFQDKFTPADFNYLNYIDDSKVHDGSLIDIEYESGGAIFNQRLTAIFTHSMGANYTKIVSHNTRYSDWSERQINHELYKVLADPAYYSQRTPYWVNSDIIGQRPAGLIYDNDHAMIVFNTDLLDTNQDLSKFYFEELGHLVNWWRCKVFGVDISSCKVNGDSGARFRDAVLVDSSLHVGSYQALLVNLPAHTEVDQVVIKFNNDQLATLDGWPHYYTMNDHIMAGGKFNWLMRLGLDIGAANTLPLTDEFDMEVSISAPSPSMKGNPWVQATCDEEVQCYCSSDNESNCNMPTMWVSVSFRDAIKMSVAKMPAVKNTTFGKSGADISPRLVRKHGGKLPFQLKSVNGTDWRYFGQHSIYYKKYTAALEAKLDLWKMGNAIAENSPSAVHKPELSLKATPGSGSYLVEIPTRDTRLFESWLAADIGSAVAGCAAGFILGVVVEEDPVLLCHGISDLIEGIETGLQALDDKPTLILEADGNISLPVSLEYKYATSGSKLMGNREQVDGASEFTTGRVVYNKDTGTNAFLNGEGAPMMAETGNPQISKLTSKTQRAFKKLGNRGISPVAVFRLRVGFDYAEKIIQPGAYNLPSAIVSD
jgi:hypothetical protein